MKLDFIISLCTTSTYRKKGMSLIKFTGPAIEGLKLITRWNLDSDVSFLLSTPNGGEEWKLEDPYPRGLDALELLKEALSPKEFIKLFALSIKRQSTTGFIDP